MNDTLESTDITRLSVDNKEIILVGTAHISQRSVDIVSEAIVAEAPDTVCVELDEQRYEALVNAPDWEALDLKQIIRNKQTTFLVARLALMAFQKRMSNYTGVKPGAEMLAAVQKADELGAEIVLADRDIRTTLLRAWRKTPFMKKAGLISMLFMGMFETQEVDEESLEDLRESHNIGEMLDSMGESLPSIKGVLVDERDVFMSDAIRKAPGDKVLAVIGAAHKRGIIEHLNMPQKDATAIEEIEVIPEKTLASKVIPWILPLIVIGVFIAGFIYGDQKALERAALAWFLVNGILGGLGALIAFGHPLTVIATFFAAPFTSLNPTVGAGMVAALVQTFVASPKVRDLEDIGEDITEASGWWKNRLSRVLLVFIGANLGSMVGTYASFYWLKDVL